MTHFDTWLDRVAAGEKATVESFARSALTDLPRVTTKPVKPNYRVYGYSSQAEMDAVATALAKDKLAGIRQELAK